ncbi:hypothetical protein LAV79_26785, partial [Peribacillus butanolivorans]
NTAVKLFSADGSWGFPPVRVGRRQANLKRSAILGWSFFVFIKWERVSNKIGLIIRESTCDKPGWYFSRKTFF